MSVNTENLRQLVAQGLLAVKAGGRRAAEATNDIQDDATDPDLKKALREGEETSKEWRARVDRAMDKVGVEGEGENPIIEAHYEVAKKNRREAPDDATRDLGIVAAGQLALHYWVAAFGTLGSYLKEMGETDAAEAMSRSVDEARRADEEHTRIAKQILGA